MARPIDKNSLPHSGWALFLGALNLLLAIAGAAVLLQIWGSIGPLQDTSGPGEASLRVWPFPRFTVPEGQIELVLATAVGLVGGTIATLLAVAKHMGDGDFNRRYAWWYVARPVWGALLAAIAYFLLLAGLVSGVSAEGGLTPAGVAVVGGLTGLFSQLVLEKLLEVAKIIFSTRAAELTQARQEATNLAETVAKVRERSDLTDDDKDSLVKAIFGT
jgi:hypothetical protein